MTSKLYLHLKFNITIQKIVLYLKSKTKEMVKIVNLKRKRLYQKNLK